MEKRRQKKGKATAFPFWLVSLHKMEVFTTFCLALVVAAVVVDV